MLSINTNVNSLVAQENLSTSQSALSQAITRLSSGKRINSAADDAAGLAISNSMQTQINGLNQGVSNANDGVSMVQTASSGLSQITASLQTIRQLAEESEGGTLTGSNQAALQQEVAQQIQEVNRVASQTNYNGINLLDGSAGTVNFQVGANVGQTISLNLTQSLSAASLGGGFVQAGNTLGTITGLDLTSTGGTPTAGGQAAITSINVLSDGSGGYTYTDQNNQAIAATVAANLFSTNTAGQLTLNASATNPLSVGGALTAINNNITADAATATTGQVFGVISNISIDAATGANVSAGAAGAASAITSITVESNGNGSYQFLDQNGNQLSAAATTAIFGSAAIGGTGTLSTASLPATTLGTAGTGATGVPGGALSNIASNNAPPTVSNINVSTTAGANAAVLAIDNALATVNNIEATIGAAQNRFTSIATAQQSQSTDLSSAQSQISNADFASETAAMSSAQVLQQAGISVLAQANSLPQQVLKLLQ
jgi:flagellin